MRFTLGEAATATGGILENAPSHELILDGVCTDTRNPRPGSLFVALRGPRFDGHGFLGDAVARGASALVIHDGTPPPGVPALRVGDTLEALGALGRMVRRKLNVAVLAVTGSVGKTTTKELAATMLREAGIPTLQTPGNWNNRVGLPLTLLGSAGDEEAAVLELGISEPGEMAHLTAICEPDAAIITAVAECHTEGLGCLEDVAREKLTVAEGLRPGGVLVLPHADPLLVSPRGSRCLTFGWRPGADVRGEDYESWGTAGGRFRVGESEVRLSLPGSHNATNALAALAGLQALGLPWERGVAGLAGVRPGALRGEVRSLTAGTKLMVDCYNANPLAVEAALSTLRDLAGSARLIAVLGEMRELGSLTAASHTRVGEVAARLGVSELHLLGDDTEWVREGAAANGLSPARIWIYQDRDALAAAVLRRMRPGDWVLVKGSRALGLEAVADALSRWSPREGRE